MECGWSNPPCHTGAMLDRDMIRRTPSGYGAPRPTKGVAMRAILSVLILVSTVAAAAAAQPDDVIRQKIVGSWGQSSTCEDGHLTFKADGTFESKGTGDPAGTAGTYSIDQGHLSGHIGESSMEVVSVDFDGDTLVIDDGSGNPERLDRCPTAQ